MFSKKIVESDIFLDMPLSTQALYFHLSMEADDDGFINNPRKIQRMLGASDDDLKLLLAKEFLISFENGVVVVKHWKIHNYIRGDRKKATIYQEEVSLLEVNSNNEYKLSKDIPAMEIPDTLNNEKEETLRQKAYKESSLPYSFNYKIKRYFHGEKCPICGVKMTDEYNLTKPSIQHNIPISKGGKHELGNISITCLSCNTSIKDNITDDLNSDEVCEVWDRIVDAERKGIDWFMNPSVLGALGDCQSNDGQMSVSCQSNDGIGKDRLGKVSKGKDSLGEVNIDKQESQTSESENSEKKKEKPKKTKKADIPQPPYYPNDEKLDEAFCEFVEFRKQMKKPLLTKKAFTRAFNRLEELSTVNGVIDNDLAIKIIEQSIYKCWTDLWELKNDSPRGNYQQAGRTNKQGIDFDALREKYKGK